MTQSNLGMDGKGDGDAAAPDQEAVADAIGGADKELHPIEEWTCVNGTVLTLRRVPQTLIGDIAMRVSKPQPPEVVIDETSGKTEANPEHPAYREALLQWAIDRSEAAFAGGIAYGVTVKELPEYMLPVEDDEWIERLERVLEATESEEIVIAREPKGKRFYHYMRYYILDDDEDLFAVSRIITARVALAEEEVMAAVASFRRMVVEHSDRIGTLTGWLNPDSDPLAIPLEGDGLGI